MLYLLRRMNFWCFINVRTNVLLREIKKYENDSNNLPDAAANNSCICTSSDAEPCAVHGEHIGTAIIVFVAHRASAEVGGEVAPQLVVGG